MTASILITASAAFFDTQTPWRGTEQIAEQLRPTLGASSGFAFALGLFAAGLTSAITAPLATAFAVCGCLGWDAQPASSRFRLIALSVIASGAILAISLGKSPAITILFAQIANGLLLPVIAVFLLVVVKKRCVADNLPKPNLSLAWLIVACVGCLGLWRVVSALA